MMFKHFLKATDEYCTLENYVPAPYFRQKFACKSEIRSATLNITGLGFYEAHINGKDITKGILAPYISNPEHYVYYDQYDITGYLHSGENVLAVILGNGFQNSAGGYIWDFDKASWRGAPLLSFRIDLTYQDGEKDVIEPSEHTKTAPSPILFDDERHGEYYDARAEIPNWDKEDFDDSGWRSALYAEPPKGIQRLCKADPIVARERLMPISVTEFQDGFIYDFGQNNAGLTELTIRNSKPGQMVILKHFETMRDSEPVFENIQFGQDERTRDYQKNIYYCRGEKLEKHLPRFTYDGFRYVLVTGITKEQATPELLTYITYSSDMKQIGSFSCDNEILNQLQEATVRSDFSNFFYFPTDCPQREKNGWTADASLSAEQMLYNMTPENGYKEWMRNIYKALNEEGQLPGIVPTSGWGYGWGFGPSWDIVIVNLPYNTYRYRGDLQIIQECSEPLNRYLHYLYSRLNEKNLLEFGLGDWCEPDKPEGDYQTPLVVTASISAVEILRKAQFIFETLGLYEYQGFAQKFESLLTKAIREHLIDEETATVFGNTQTAQAMGLYYGFFEGNAFQKGFRKLLELIREKDDHCYCGVVGASVFYKVLAENGYADLAVRLITRTDFPSYGNWIARGATTLWETYRREGDVINSLNHHFWGFISEWLYKYIAGIKINPTLTDVNTLEISPCFLETLNRAEASYCPAGSKAHVSWKRRGKGVVLTVELSKNYHGRLILPQGYCFTDGKTVKELCTDSTRYEIIRE